MFVKLITSNIELVIFILVEFAIIIPFIVLFKYSRNHGGVFDRRVQERRSRKRRVIDWYLSDNGYYDTEYDKVKINESAGNDSFEVYIHKYIYGRRNGERRLLPERRKA